MDQYALVQKLNAVLDEAERELRDEPLFVVGVYDVAQRRREQYLAEHPETEVSHPGSDA